MKTDFNFGKSKKWSSLFGWNIQFLVILLQYQYLTVLFFSVYASNNKVSFLKAQEG